MTIIYLVESLFGFTIVFCVGKPLVGLSMGDMGSWSGWHLAGGGTGHPHKKVLWCRLRDRLSVADLYSLSLRLWGGLLWVGVGHPTGMPR